MRARICARYVPFVPALPLVIAVLIVLSHVLRLLIPYRPRWLQPFVEEFVNQEELPKRSRKRRLDFPIAALLILSLGGFVLQAVTVWKPVFYVQAVYPALTWVRSSSRIAALC